MIGGSSSCSFTAVRDAMVNRVVASPTLVATPVSAVLAWSPETGPGPPAARQGILKTNPRGCTSLGLIQYSVSIWTHPTSNRGTDEREVSFHSKRSTGSPALLTRVSHRHDKSSRRPSVDPTAPLPCPPRLPARQSPSPRRVAAAQST